MPSRLQDYFTITRVAERVSSSTKDIEIEIYLEEKNQIPSGYDIHQYESKGFYPTRRIQDFPIRGKAVYLVIKRRRWRHKTNKNEIIVNDYSLIAEGSKLTKELSDFLKGIDRNPSRHD